MPIIPHSPSLLTSSLIFYSDYSTNHKLSSFTALTEEITSHYKQLLKSAEERITEMCKVSKETWRKLDDEEEKCDKWIQEIKRVRDEQVRMYFRFCHVK